MFFKLQFFISFFIIYDGFTHVKKLCALCKIQCYSPYMKFSITSPIDIDYYMSNIILYFYFLFCMFSFMQLK